MSKKVEIPSSLYVRNPIKFLLDLRRKYLAASESDTEQIGNGSRADRKNLIRVGSEIIVL